LKVPFLTPQLSCTLAAAHHTHSVCPRARAGAWAHGRPIASRRALLGTHRAHRLALLR
jgi:hypothetical protein